MTEKQKWQKKRSRIMKRTLWAIIPLLILLAIYLIWDIRGFAVGCTIVAASVSASNVSNYAGKIYKMATTAWIII